jgi:thiol peroxidase
MSRRFVALAAAPLMAALIAGCASGGTRPAERHGVVTMRGAPLTLVGPVLEVGQRAPAFTAVANDMSTFSFRPGDGVVWIISAVPSLDTPVCSAETRRFNEAAASLGPGIKVLTVSMDLPFAQRRWCAAEGIENLQTVSDYRDRCFAEHYGVRIRENGLLARSVFVIGPDGRIRYIQIVPEISSEPQYEPVLAAARMARGS